MVDEVEGFEGLGILHFARLRSLDILPVAKITLGFFTGKGFDVQFNRVLDFRLDMPLDGHTYVESRAAFRKSEFLDACIAHAQRAGQIRLPRDRLVHFQLDFGDSQLDVAAEEFTYSLYWN